MEQGIKTDASMGDAIRRARRRMGLTQDQVAARMQTGGCDLSRGTLAKIEAGIRHLSVGELRLLREILQMEYEDFFR